jgi:hypothetical protein
MRSDEPNNGLSRESFDVTSAPEAHVIEYRQEWLTVDS